MVTSPGYGDDTVEVARHRALAIGILPPRHNGAVGFQRQAVVASRGDGNNVAQSDRHRTLSVPEAIIPPSYDSPIGLKSQTVLKARSDGCEECSWLNR